MPINRSGSSNWHQRVHFYTPNFQLCPCSFYNKKEIRFFCKGKKQTGVGTKEYTVQQSLTFVADGGTLCKSHLFSFVGERGSDSFGCSQGQCQVKYVCLYEGFWHASSLFA